MVIYVGVMRILLCLSATMFAYKRCSVRLYLKLVVGVYKRFQYERAVSLFWFSTAYVKIFHSVQWLKVKCVIVRFAYIGGIRDQYRLNFLFMKYVWNYQCILYKTNRQHAIYYWHLGHFKKNETHIRNWHEHRLIIIHCVNWAYNTNVLLNTVWQISTFDWPVNWLGCTNRNCKQIYILILAVCLFTRD